MFDATQLSVIWYCAEEVRRQRDDQLHVAYMLNAWDYASRVAPREPLTVGHVLHVASLVKPSMNSHGWRTEDVIVGPRRCPDHELVPGLMEQWGARLRAPEKMHELATEYATDQMARGHLVNLKAVQESFAASAYFAFEHVHPFVDGNGRTGKIIYNWLLGGLEDPTWPPQLWPGVENV